MKLIYCPKCHDVRKLDYPEVVCKCGASSGSSRIGGLHAVIRGAAIPLGFNNASLMDCLCNRPEDGAGLEFTAFVIPKDCPTVTKLDN